MREKPSRALFVMVGEGSIFYCYFYFFRRCPLHEACQQLAADFREECLCENRVHHAAAALEFRAAAGNQVDHRVIITESYFPILADSFLNAAQLQLDDRP